MNLEEHIRIVAVENLKCIYVTLETREIEGDIVYIPQLYERIDVASFVSLTFRISRLCLYIVSWHTNHNTLNNDEN